MIRRWLIRVPCLLALALVVAAWMTSYMGSLTFQKHVGGYDCEVGVVQGLTYMREIYVPLPSTPLQLRFASEDKGGRLLEGLTAPGFYGGRWPGEPDSFLIVFPLWFPMLLLAGLYWFLWRKTRDKGPGQGFPVEPATPTHAREQPPK